MTIFGEVLAKFGFVDFIITLLRSDFSTHFSIFSKSFLRLTLPVININPIKNNKRYKGVYLVY